MIDIVIPVHGRFDLLEKCLASIPEACQYFEYKIFVVDDASPEGIAETKKFFKNYPDIKVSFNTKNAGFPFTVNKGARKGYGKYIFLLNSDVILEKHSLDVMLSRMESEEKLGVLGMKLLFPEDVPPQDVGIRPPGTVQHVGISFNINGRPHHIFIAWDKDNPKVNAIYEVPAITGAAFLTRREIWNKLRGMDEVWGLGTFEDVDFCFKARTIGYYVAVDTAAVGTHYVGGSSASVDAKERKGFPIAQNEQLFYNRWMGQIHWSDWILL